jgi:hypothetical protein
MSCNVMLHDCTRHIILLDIKTSVVKACLLPVHTYGCEIWGMDSTSGANRLKTLLNQCLRRLVWVAGAKAPGVATTPLLRELGIAPIEATAAAARIGRSLKRPP